MAFDFHAFLSKTGPLAILLGRQAGWRRGQPDSPRRQRLKPRRLHLSTQISQGTDLSDPETSATVRGRRGRKLKRTRSLNSARSSQFRPDESTANWLILGVQDDRSPELYPSSSPNLTSSAEYTSILTSRVPELLHHDGPGTRPCDLGSRPSTHPLGDAKCRWRLDTAIIHLLSFRAGSSSPEEAGELLRNPSDAD